MLWSGVLVFYAGSFEYLDDMEIRAEGYPIQYAYFLISSQILAGLSGLLFGIVCYYSTGKNIRVALSCVNMITITVCSGLNIRFEEDFNRGTLVAWLMILFALFSLMIVFKVRSVRI